MRANSLNAVSVIIALTITSLSLIEAQEMPDKFAKIPVGPDGNPRSLSMEEVIRFVLENNTTVRLQRLEVVKADTDISKEKSTYAPRADFRARYFQEKDPFLPSTLFTGTKVQQNAYMTGIEKVFESGTYTRIEISDTRFDSNAGEGPVGQSNQLLAMLAQPPVHTGAVTIQLQQDLMKNSFGYSQKRLMEIARKKSMLQREQLEYRITALVVKTIVDYWNLAIAEEDVVSARLLLDNTINLRAITAQKVRIGLSEGFELNQWNALVNAAQIQVQTCELNRDRQRTDLMRALNLDPSAKLQGMTDLVQTLPVDINRDADLQYALEHRPDLKAMDRQIEIAKISAELAENNLLPTVRIGGRYSSRDFGRQPDQAFRDVPGFRYPETGAEFYVQYPLWDEGAKVDVRNARIAIRQLQLQKEEIHRQVRDDIATGNDEIKVAYTSLEKARAALRQTESFYYGIVGGYQTGRFAAAAVKNALDALVQSRQGVTQATIRYNMALTHYDMIRNRIFVKNHIDIDDVLSRSTETSE